MFENQDSLFQKFQSEGYITGGFGKIVNKVTDYFCDEQRTTGFDRIHLSCDYENFYGTEYYNLYVDGTWDKQTHDLTSSVYQTAMMGNASVTFVEEMMEEQTSDPYNAQPFILWLGPYAPHTSATPAEWYAEAFDGVELVDEGSFNQVCEDHHAPVGNNDVLGSDAQAAMLQLYKDRLRSLMSVDDMVGGIMDVLDEYPEAGENTYVIYTRCVLCVFVLKQTISVFWWLYFVVLIDFCCDLLWGYITYSVIMDIKLDNLRFHVVRCSLMMLRRGYLCILKDQVLLRDLRVINWWGILIFYRQCWI